MVSEYKSKRLVVILVAAGKWVTLTMVMQALHDELILMKQAEHGFTKSDISRCSVREQVYRSVCRCFFIR